VFVVPLGPAAKRVAVRLVGQLREAGIATDTVYGDRGLKGAMKAADRSGASYAIVLGERDLEARKGSGQFEQVLLEGGPPVEDEPTT
jgi:histidyl-tRNA synthetase